jgi:hypothetical protein
MQNQNQLIRRTATVLLACGLIACLLPGFAVAQDLSTYEARRQWLFEQMRADDRSRSTHISSLNWSLSSLYMSDGQDEVALEHLARVMETHVERQKLGGADHSRHFGPFIVRALHMYGDRLSADQIERIRRAATSEAFRNVTAAGTENHAMDYVSMGYLLAQYFPGETWNTTEGLMTSQELMDLNRGRILSRGKGYYRVGHREQLSTTYDQLCVRSSVNLWEFARDPVVRDAGEALALYHVGLHALNNFDGHTMPPFSRRNGLQARFPWGPSGLNHHGYAAWLYWGQNEVVSPIVSFDRENTQLASSSWRMPGPMNRIALGADAPYEIRGASGENSVWGHEPRMLKMLRYVWRDRDFAIGGPVGQIFVPDGYYTDYHVFNIVWKSGNRLRALETMHPYWNTSSPRYGENYWRGTHSPFQQFGIHRNVAITLFNIPTADPWAGLGPSARQAKRSDHFKNLIKLGQVRFPTTVDEVVGNGDFYFFREGDVYVAICVLKPGHTLHRILKDDFSNELFHVVKSREAKTGFVFEVGTAKEHGSFMAFQQAVKKNPLVVDWGKLEVSYTSTLGDQLRFRYDTDYKEDKQRFIKIVPDLWINGQQREADFNTWPVAESPVMTLKNSILRIDQGGQRVEVDWSGELPRINRR